MALKVNVGIILGLLAITLAGCTSGNSGGTNSTGTQQQMTSCQEQISNFMAACIKEFAQVTQKQVGNWNTRNAGYHLCQDGSKDPIPGRKLDTCYKKYGKGRFPVSDLNR
jgi:ABC-type phosphate transport system substrate-binding protein